VSTVSVYNQVEESVIESMAHVDEINRALTTATMEDQKDVVEDIMSPRPMKEPVWFNDLYDMELEEEEKSGKDIT